MSISTRDKKILLMFSGVAVFAVGYLFGYRPQMEKAEEIQTASEPLETRLNELLEMAQNKDFYISETDRYNQEVSTYIADFPADIKEEDGIILARNMANTLDMDISNIGTNQKEFVASLDGSTEEEISEGQEQTLSEQANEQTQEQIDDIEGTASQTQDDMGNTIENMDNLSQVAVLYRSLDTLQFTGTYESLKNVVDYVASQSGRITLDSVDAAFDSTTGNLTGTITVNMFSMTGTGKEYTEPDAGSVALGRPDLFGTIEAAQASTDGTVPDNSQTAENGSDISGDAVTDTEATDNGQS